MQFEKGRAKTGGRKAGTCNKSTAFTRDIINSLLGDYQSTGMMDKDFLALDPKDRITIAERLIQYVMPKMHATSLDVSSETKKTIEDQLRELAKEND